MNFLIVEDKRIDELNLLSITSKYADLKHVKTATNAHDTTLALHKFKPDVVFMDIEFPGGSGLELLRILKLEPPIVIFVTSHPEFALDGFELSALDYLLKPVSEERFQITYRRIKEYWEMKVLAQARLLQLEKDIIVIKEGYNKVLLQINDIIYLEAMQDYTKIVTLKKKYMVNSTLAGFLSKQNQEIFVRVHRSYAVAKKNIREVHPDKVVGEFFSLPIGKTYRQHIAKMGL